MHVFVDHNFLLNCFVFILRKNTKDARNFNFVLRKLIRCLVQIQNKADSKLESSPWTCKFHMSFIIFSFPLKVD